MSYYHVVISLFSRPNKDALEVDLNEIELRKGIVIPINQGERFACGDETIDASDISAIKITESEHTLKRIYPTFFKEANYTEKWRWANAEKDVTRRFIKFRPSKKIFPERLMCPLHGATVPCTLTEEIQSEYSEKKIFINIPYRDEYQPYEDKIVEVIKRFELTPVLAKEEVKSDILLCKICRKIQSCKYGISDISYMSINVPYELGLLHALEKRTAILKRRDAELPTDVRGIEVLPYINTDTLEVMLSKWIHDNIQEVP